MNKEGQTLDAAPPFRETREKPSQQGILWTAGLFEAGGSMKYRVWANSIYPYIRYTDTNQKAIDRLVLLYGGRVRPIPKTNSMEWILSGSPALSLATSIEPFAPSRKPYTQLAKNWDSLSPQERRQASLDYINRSDSRDPASYRNLLTEPAFVAGVLDARGYFSHDGKTPRISLVSTNKSLMNQIQEKYGGNLQVRKGNSLAWLITHRKAQAFYAAQEPVLMSRAKEFENVFLSYVEQQQLVDDREAFAHEKSHWLAGFFEAGGTMGLMAGTPYIAIGGAKLEAAQRFMETFAIFAPSYVVGGELQQKRVEIRGRSASAMARGVRELLPSRKDFIKTAAEYQHIKPSRRRRVLTRPSLQELHEDEYVSLVKDPQFMAGVIDSRGSFLIQSHSRIKDYKYAILNITSTNKALLLAIHKQYGGSMPSQRVKLHETNTSTIVLCGKNVAVLYSLIKPYLLLKADRGREVMERTNPQQITNYILTALAEQMNIISIPQLQERVRELIGIHMVSQAAIIRYVKQLMQEGRMTGSLAKAGALQFSLYHSDNISIVQHSSVALERFFQEALKQEIVISALGEVVAIGSDMNSYIWFSNRKPKDYARQLLSKASKSGNLFTQISDQGRVLNYFRNIRSINDIKQLAAIQESIEMAFTRAYEYIIDNFEGMGGPELPREAPNEIAQRFIREARYNQ